MLHKFLNYTLFWQKRRFINYLLLPFSLIWVLLSCFRRMRKPYRSSLFIISVGNLNLGGSGKTPTVILLGNLLKQQGYKVAFLSKGYNGKANIPTWVNKDSSFIEVGDEPILLEQYCPTIISKNIPLALKILEKENFDIVITDDLLQNPSFYKNFILVVINAQYGLGNNMIFPAGPLRQSANKGLRNANAVILLEGHNASVEKQSEIFKLDIFCGKYILNGQLPKNNKPVIAFCGIGMPQKFYTTLNNLGFKVQKLVTYPDHYIYKEQDIIELIQESQLYNLPLITTEKDFLKIPFAYRDKILSLNIKLELNQHTLLLNKIINEYNKATQRTIKNN